MRCRVPKWALRHPLHAQRLVEAAEDIFVASQLHPLDVLDQLAQVCHAAVSEVRISRSRRRARSFLLDRARLVVMRADSCGRWRRPRRMGFALSATPVPF